MVSRSAHVHHTEHVTSEHAANYGISGERASEIQAALIRQGYMTGEPTGTWDANTAAAMTKLQLDNGWQRQPVSFHLYLGCSVQRAFRNPADDQRRGEPQYLLVLPRSTI